MTKKLLLAFLIVLIGIGSAFAGVNWPVKSVINPLASALYVPDNSTTPATVKIYPRIWPMPSTNDHWQTSEMQTITLPAGKCSGLAVSPNGKKLFIGVNDVNNNNVSTGVLVYSLDQYGKPQGSYTDIAIPGLASSNSSITGMAADELFLYVVDSGLNDVHLFTLNNNSYFGKLSQKLVTGSSPFLASDNLDSIAVTAMEQDRMPIVFISSRKNSGTVYMFSNLVLGFKYLGVVPNTLTLPGVVSVSNNGDYLAVAVNSTATSNAADVSLYDISNVTIDSAPVTKIKDIKSNNNASGDYWSSVAFTPNNQTVYFTNNKTLYKIAVSGPSTTGTSVATIAHNPEGLVADPAGIKMVLTYNGSKIEYGTGSTAPVAPIIESVTPNSTTIGNAVSITVRGKNFLNNPNSGPKMAQASLKMGETGYLLTDIVVISPTQFTATVPNTINKAGVFDLKAGNFYAGEPTAFAYAIKLNAFTINFTKPALSGSAKNLPQNDDTGLPHGGDIIWKWTLNPSQQGQISFELIDGNNQVVETISNPLSIFLSQHLGSGNSNKELTRQLRVIGSGVEKLSNTVKAYTAANYASNLTAAYNASQNKIILNWSANGNPAYTDYKVYRLVKNPFGDGEIPLEKEGVLVENATTYNYADSLTSNATYKFYVTSVNGDGIENIHNPPNVSCTTGGVGPVEGISVTITKNNNNVVLDWTTNPVGQAVDIYTLTCNQDADGNYASYFSLTGNWINEFPNITGNTKTDLGQIGNGKAKYYKLVPAGAVPDYTKNVVGKFDVKLKSGAFNFVSTPLAPSNDDINNVIGNQLYAEEFEFAGDLVYFPNNQDGFDIAWLNKNGSWCLAGTEANPSNIKINTDLNKGFYIYVNNIFPAHIDKNISFIGLVEDSASKLQTLYKAKFNSVGNPYPVLVNLGITGLLESGLQSNEFEFGGSVLYAPNAQDGFDTAWLNSNGNWYDTGQTPETQPNGTSIQLKPGVGYYIFNNDINNPSESIEWIFNNPKQQGGQ